MDIKQVNRQPNPLSEKIVKNTDKPFKLWLEFENTSPWDDIDNTFANIAVDTLDGRSYGINVWTFKFLETARQEHIKQGDSGLYVVPPDLFVAQMTRDCMESTIKELLNQGDLEDVLNPTVFGLKFLAPYEDYDSLEQSTVEAIIKEIHLEIGTQNILNLTDLEILAKKTHNDDVVVETTDGEIAVIHLTWSAKAEQSGYPIMRVYKDKKTFWLKEMREDVLEFREW